MFTLRHQTGLLNVKLFSIERNLTPVNYCSSLGSDPIGAKGERYLREASLKATQCQLFDYGNFKVDSMMILWTMSAELSIVITAWCPLVSSISSSTVLVAIAEGEETLSSFKLLKSSCEKHSAD